jgi:hypothetical protein
MPRLRRLPRRLGQGLRLLTAAHGRDRLLLARYLGWDALNHLAHVPVNQREVELKLDDIEIRLDLFGSQLGSFIEIFQKGEYDLVPGFRGYRETRS